MALIRALSGSSGGGGNSKYDHPADGTSVTTYPITTDFQPKKIIVFFRYNNTYNFTCIYDAENSTTSFLRYGNADASPSTGTLPNNTTLVGIQNVNPNGFDLFCNGGNVANIYYIAKG